MATFPTTFVDSQGELTTEIVSDGVSLRTKLRGVEFVGNDFDSLEPTSPVEAGRFALHQGELCQCEFHSEIPVDILREEGGAFRFVTGKFHVVVVLGKPDERRGLDRQSLQIKLSYDGQTYAGSGSSGWFDDELAEVQRQMPPNDSLRCCYGCQYSDYPPGGHGMFGSMLCFRNRKAEYMAARSKRDLLCLLGDEDEYVQETHVCDQYSRRLNSVGYRS